MTDSRFPVGDVDLDLVERAAGLRSLLESNAAACERERRIVDENLAALEEARLLDVMLPKRLGGLGATMATQLAVAAELANGCASTSWVQTLLTATTWGVTLLCPEGQETVTGGDEPARVCGVITPTGKAVRVDGGYRVTGRWGFASGCLHANWATGGIFVHDGDGGQVDQGVAYMPIGELRIEDTWHVAGMRGTGSNTLVADDLFVPEHVVATSANVLGVGRDPNGLEPSDRWPLFSVLALVLTGPMLGMGEAALASVSHGAYKRGISYTTYERQTDSAVLLRDVAEASLHVETARLHVFACAAEVDAAGAGADMDFLARARLRGACGYVTHVLRTAMDALVSVAGASSFAESNAMQRHWRDLNVASRHAFLATSPSYELYGRAMFGVENVTLLI